MTFSAHQNGLVHNPGELAPPCDLKQPHHARSGRRRPTLRLGHRSSGRRPAAQVANLRNALRTHALMRQRRRYRRRRLEAKDRPGWRDARPPPKDTRGPGRQTGGVRVAWHPRGPSFAVRSPQQGAPTNETRFGPCGGVHPNISAVVARRIRRSAPIAVPLRDAWYGERDLMDAFGAADRGRCAGERHRVRLARAGRVFRRSGTRRSTDERIPLATTPQHSNA